MQTVTLLLLVKVLLTAVVMILNRPSFITLLAPFLLFRLNQQIDARVELNQLATFCGQELSFVILLVITLQNLFVSFVWIVSEGRLRAQGIEQLDV